MSTQNTHHGAKKISEYLAAARCRRVFFCGVGGINMCALAEWTLDAGYAVVGYDRTPSPLTEALAQKGAEIYYEHDASRVDSCDAFVYTVAIPDDTPEFVRALALGIPVISRADYLGYVMTLSPRRIGICGTHGKSSTTAMCEAIFTAAERDPAVMCGAEMASCGSVYRSGRGGDFIFEACEYMDSFLDFNPTTAVILNVELDHVDYFADLAQMRRSYARFADITGEDGFAVVNGDDAQALLSLSEYKGNILTFGLSENNELTAGALAERGGFYSFDLILRGESLCRIDLSVPGLHNVIDALGAAGAALTNGVALDAVARGLASYRGISRRMEYKGKINGARVFDDYAHHPTEIEATLSTARSLCEGKLITVFGSHTYSRTHELMSGFASALSLADVCIVAPIYAAREENLWGVSQYTLADAVGKNAVGMPDFESCAEAVKKAASAGDIVIIMGAGDVIKVTDLLGLCEK